MENLVLYSDNVLSNESIISLGLKGYNLFKLQKDGFKVPFTCIHKYNKYLTLEEQKIEVPNFPLMPDKFAVRSSGSKSKPGLMDTFLNVSKEELPTAIKAVFSSAKEIISADYTFNIAAVIQEMIHPSYSGVAFTGDLNSFKPIIHYVEGTGENLVGGKVTPKDFINSPAFIINHKNQFFNTLKNIHDTYGPSDVEWVFNGFNFYIVQVRPIKSFDLFSEVKDNWVPPEQFTFLTKGTPIGSKTWTSSASSLVYKLTSMNPKEVDKIGKSQIVLTTEGGDTSHAALIARDKGISAIRLENPNVIDGYKIILASPEGNLYGANTYVKYKLPEKINIKLNKHKIVKGTWAPLPLNNVVGRLVSLENILLYFYNKINDPEYTGYDVAKLISTYCYFACLGEIRHVKDATLRDFWTKLLEIKGLEKDGVTVPLSSEYNRDYFNTKSKTNKYLEASSIITIIETMITTFSTKYAFKPAYGGRKWARIAKLLLKFITGKMTTIMFVDKCLQIQHNCGNLFNKFAFLYTDIIAMNKLLDYRRQDYNILYNKVVESVGQEAKQYPTTLVFQNNLIELIKPNSTETHTEFISNLLKEPKVEPKAKKKKCPNTEPISGTTTDIEMSMTQ